jgi:hypothetical protein
MFKCFRWLPVWCVQSVHFISCCAFLICRPGFNQQIVNGLPIQIPLTAAKWLTYALVLNIVALVSSAIATFLGLLAHVREMSMSRGTSIASGFSSTMAFFALVFNISFTLLARNRVKATQGNSASIGSALWLSLVAWLLLTIGTCFYTIGRCCQSRRKKEKVPDFNDSIGNMIDIPARNSTRRTRRFGGGLPASQELSNEKPTEAFVNGDVVESVRPQEPCKLFRVVRITQSNISNLLAISSSSSHLSNTSKVPGQVPGHNQRGTSCKNSCCFIDTNIERALRLFSCFSTFISPRT